MCSFRYSLLGYRFYATIRDGEKPSSLVQETKKPPNLAELAQGKGIHWLAPSVQSPLKISLGFEIKDSKSSIVYYSISILLNAFLIFRSQ